MSAEPSNITTITFNPILARQLDARLAHVRAQHPQLDVASYIGDVLHARATRYADHVRRMTITPDLAQWALAMTQQFGPYVLVHHFVADWITALLILRYGEEERGYDAVEVAAAQAEGRAPACSTDPAFTGWPLAFSDEDRARARELLSQAAWPRHFTLLTPEG
jgi:hypothetical protein